MTEKEAPFARNKFYYVQFPPRQKTPSRTNPKQDKQFPRTKPRNLINGLYCVGKFWFFTINYLFQIVLLMICFFNIVIFYYVLISLSCFVFLALRLTVELLCDFEVLNRIVWEPRRFYNTSELQKV